MIPAAQLDDRTIAIIAERVNEHVLGNLVEMGLDQVIERVDELCALVIGSAAGRGAKRLVDAEELAGILGVSRECVYDNAPELGGQKIGSGARGRWRFNPDVALSRWSARSDSKESTSQDQPSPAGNSRRRKRAPAGRGADLLPIGPLRNSETGADDA